MIPTDKRLLFGITCLWLGTLFLVYQYTRYSAYLECDRRGHEMFKLLYQSPSWQISNDSDDIKKSIEGFLIHPSGYRKSGLNDLFIYQGIGILLIALGLLGLDNYRKNRKFFTLGWRANRESKDHLINGKSEAKDNP